MSDRGDYILRYALVNSLGLALNTISMVENDLLNKPYAEVMAPRPLRSLFTYSVPESMRAYAVAGKRVLIPFGSRKLIGLIARRVYTTDIKTKPILQILDEKPVVPPSLLKLTLWTADHYFAAPGELMPIILPKDDIRIDTVVELKAGAKGRPSKSSKILVEVYEALQAHNGRRRFTLLASDLQITASALTKALTSQSARQSFKQSQAARRVAIRSVKTPLETSAIKLAPVELTDEQQNAVERILPDIKERRFNTHLIHGITGSGKTEVYAKLISAALQAGMSALALAPEIALADALAVRLERRTGVKPVTLHSDMAPRERNRRWMEVLEGGAKLVVGARSALFAPVPNLGLVVVDEEHDPSYKQETAPRYHGRDVAIMRGAMENVPVVLGSATPSLESYHHALNGKYNLIELTHRIDKRPLPNVRIAHPDKPGQIGQILGAAIDKCLADGEQALLFINRRGMARYVKCSACGHVFECRNCSLSLVLHMSSGQMSCHTCGYVEEKPAKCPDCSSTDLYMGGSGSERVETEAKELFPNARIARMDKDTTSKRRSSASILNAVESRNVDILIGTQMVTKGHDYPGITLVGAINADDTLHIPDFRSSERAFQLVTQAAGRAGRGEKPGFVVAQTLSETHHSITAAAKHDFKAFYATEIPIRKAAGYPPYVRLAFVRIEASTTKRGEAFVKWLESKLSGICREEPGLTCLGPTEAVVFKARNKYHWRVLFKGANHATLSSGVRRFLAEVDKVPKHFGQGIKIAVDMDPATVL